MTRRREGSQAIRGGPARRARRPGRARPSPPARPVRRGAGRPAACAALLLSMLALACASLPPVRSFRAARYYAAGTNALDRGDSAVAIAELERAAALMPSASEIQNHLGLAYWSDGREDAALGALERAVELDCDNDAARVNLARLRFERAARRANDGASDERSTSNGG